jgi:nucleotide-binding universal stress UspA family protein
MKLTRILVPIDFSADADAAFRYAIALSKQCHASIHLLHVVENPLATGTRSSESYTADAACLYIRLLCDAERWLNHTIPVIAGPPAGVTREVRTGDAAGAMVAVANERLVDLIVMGTGGGNGVGRLVIGSVAERVVRSALCTVLTVRASRSDVPSTNNRRANAHSRDEPVRVSAGARAAIGDAGSHMRLRASQAIHSTQVRMVDTR